MAGFLENDSFFSEIESEFTGLDGIPIHKNPSSTPLNSSALKEVKSKPLMAQYDMKI